MHNIYYLGLSGEHRCPLGYLLIESSSFLQVTRTTIKAWMSLNFGGISPLTAELAALERLKKTYSLSSAYIFVWIFFILAGNKGNYSLR